MGEVRRGLRGTAWTVFEGVNPEPMDVEILGVLKNAIGPGQDMILGRLHGVKPEFTGVVAGMSGSPVYVDGKLLGALSYRIGQFSKEPICGITPIAQMFEVRDASSAGEPLRSERSGTNVDTPARESTGQTGMLPIDTPLVFSGFSAAAMERYGSGFRALGLEPVSGLGSASPNTAQPEPIIPGSAVSAILARGDLSIAATCTVTYTDAHRLLACGHPITQQGRLSVPMTKATVVATLPSPMNAFKIVNTTETVGALTQDRSSAVAGIFGSQARMVPVHVELTAPSGSGLQSRTINFEVANNRELTPQIMLASVFQALNGTDTSSGSMSLRLQGTIKVEGAPAIHFDQMLSPGEASPPAVQGALLIGGAVSRLYDNALEQPAIQQVSLQAEILQSRHSAEIQSARLSSSEASAGDRVMVEITLRPYHAPAKIVRIPVTLPATLTQGPLRILVGDGASLDRLLAAPAASAHALSLAETAASLNRLHRNDRVYVTLLEHETQAVTAANTLPALPPSFANALHPMRETHEIAFAAETACEAGSAAVGDAVTGSQVLTLQIR